MTSPPGRVGASAPEDPHVPGEVAAVGTPMSDRRLRIVAAVARGRDMAATYAWAIGPTIVLIAAVIARLPLLLGPVAPPLNDAREYILSTESLLAGNGFGVIEDYRGPGYPVFLALISFLPGPLLTEAVVVQHLLGIVLAVGLCTYLGRRHGPVAGTMAGLLLACSPAMVDAENSLLTDFLFGFVLALSVPPLVAALRSPEASRRLFLLSGALIGVATLVKPVGQPLVLVPLILALWRTWSRKSLAAALFAVLGFLLVVAPWSVRNVAVYGHPQLTTELGPALWLRTFDGDKLPLPPVRSPNERLAADAYRKQLLGAESSPGALTETYAAVASAFHSRRVSRLEADRTMRTVALRAIKQYPRVYVRRTLDNAKALLRPPGIAAQATIVSRVRSGNVPGADLAMKAWGFGRWLSRLGWALSVGLLLALPLMWTGAFEARWSARAAVLLTAILVALIAATNYPETRFQVLFLAPWAALLAAATALLVRALQVMVVRDRDRH